MEPEQLSEVQAEVLDELTNGRATKGYIVDETGRHRNSVGNALNALESEGLIRTVHEGTSLYELVADPRRGQGDIRFPDLRDDMIAAAHIPVLFDRLSTPEGVEVVITKVLHTDDSLGKNRFPPEDRKCVDDLLQQADFPARLRVGLHENYDIGIEAIEWQEISDGESVVTGLEISDVVELDS
jgi:hypothetical protein